MRLLGLAATLALVLSGCTQEAAIPDADAQAVSERDLTGVASVIDGDTIEMHGTRIRLSGYDTPERGARCGNQNVYQRAANELDTFLAGRTVRCATTGTDSYDRTVATCSVGGTDLGEHMVSEGWGRDWPRYSHGAYADEEAAARGASRGLWGLSCPSDLWGSRSYN
jgi:endonuclease YncB( thermonuclease family)